MREYETTFIVQPEISDDVREAFLAKVDGLLESEGAVRLMLDDWGKRKLAYEIQNFQKGHYYSLKYVDSGTIVAPLERMLKLEESILRYLTVRVADVVADLDARKAESAEEETKLRERLEAERTAREEEEKARREAEARAAAEAAEAATAAEAAAAKDAAAAPEGEGEAAEAAAAEDAAAAPEVEGEAAEAAADPPPADEAADSGAAADADEGKGKE